jgi:hypothetical protein
MYWLEADSADRAANESWVDYTRRSCAEVMRRFQHLMSETDFAKEASNWQLAIDPVKDLVFVAYFVRETDLLAFNPDIPRNPRLQDFRWVVSRVIEN